jgi:hypothetical protein
LKNNFILRKNWKGIFLLVFFALVFFSCENHRFDSDKRQIISKDEIENKLGRVRSFDITGFNEDTVTVENNPDFKKQIRYTLDITFVDSNNVLQKKKGIVMFTPDGQTIINSKITDQ